MDLRWGGNNTNRIRALAQELVDLRPDIIVTNATPPTIAVQRETRTIQIVFANAADPVASGIVARLDRPGGNITGFATYEAPLGGKWLELLSEIVPGLKRATVMFNPDSSPTWTYMLPALETATRSLKVVTIRVPVVHGRPCIACRSYWRQLETTYLRSMCSLSMPETAVCSPTEATR